MSLDLNRHMLSMNLGITLVGEALNGKLKNPVGRTFVPDEVQEALVKFATLMLTSGYLEGIEISEQASRSLQEQLFEAKVDMPQFPYYQDGVINE